MNIGSGNGYPESALSNFSPHPFTFDDVLCNSMEGLLQAFKTKHVHIQEHICSLVGRAAKFAGKKHNNWKDTQTLHWCGVEYPRNSTEYQQLLDRAYQAMYNQSESFRIALWATGAAVLTHSIGRSNPKETVLTEAEFVRRLHRLRAIDTRKGIT